ncbi:response regulator [Agrococcus sp. TF02-5]|nr:response regulator [Agrococcus sp. TF02-05]
MEHHERELSAASTPREGGPVSGRILVVDDDRDIRDLVAIKLESAGHDVVTRADGAQALEAGMEGGWDVIVLDVMMPGMSGIDVLRTLRDRGVETPVILLTARGQEKDIEAGFAAGADHYVTKPFSPRALLARVTAALG